MRVHTTPFNTQQERRVNCYGEEGRNDSATAYPAFFSYL
jgi:hypothetical protein